MSCVICEVRKEKRFCLALHDRICPQCCGEQREVTLDCPPECPYLQQAREHEKPRELSDAIRELTDGNAFLVCELWRALVESGAVELVPGGDGNLGEFVLLGEPVSESIICHSRFIVRL